MGTPRAHRHLEPTGKQLQTDSLCYRSRSPNAAAGAFNTSASRRSRLQHIDRRYLQYTDYRLEKGQYAAAVGNRMPLGGSGPTRPVLKKDGSAGAAVEPTLVPAASEDAFDGADAGWPAVPPEENLSNRRGAHLRLPIGQALEKRPNGDDLINHPGVSLFSKVVRPAAAIP